MFRVYVVAIILFIMSPAAIAKTGFGMSYNSVSEDIGVGIDTTSLSIDLVYEFFVSDTLSLIPSVSIGKGISDDTFSTIFVLDDGFSIAQIEAKIELDSNYQLAVKASYKLNDAVSFYLSPAYLKTNYSSMPASNIDEFFIRESDDWELGIGIGVDYSISSTIYIGIGFFSFEDKKLTSASIAYTF